MTSRNALIDDLSAQHSRAASGAVWELVSDRVMGGVSHGMMTREFNVTTALANKQSFPLSIV